MSLDHSLSLVDTHCHLNFDLFDLDRDSVVEKAREQGVSRILIPGVDLETSASALKLTSVYPEVYSAVGIHPNSGMNWSRSIESDLRQMLKEEKVLAIGEIGLDYYRNQLAKDEQRSLFEAQLSLASDCELPVVIHNRDASDDTHAILDEWYSSIDKQSRIFNFPGVMHSFSGDLEFAQKMIDLNFKLGINGPVTFRNSDQLQAVVRAIPSEKLLIETDAPFLTPIPFRGKRNEPANVRIVVEKIAEIKSLPVEEIIRITTSEADRLFRWRDIN